MNPSYFRIKLPFNEAVERLCEWNEGKYSEKIPIALSDAVDVCLDSEGKWKKLCIYAYENNGWSVFEDMSGAYSFIGSEEWLKFAKNDELIVAGYNDAMLYGEFIAMSGGKVIKEFLEIHDEPEENVNSGEWDITIESWVDVAEIVDEDEYAFSEVGTVYIF